MFCQSCCSSETIKSWVPQLAKVEYHQPIAIITGIALAAIAFFVTQNMVSMVVCGVISVATAAVGYFVSLYALRHFANHEEPPAKAPTPPPGHVSPPPVSDAGSDTAGTGFEHVEASEEPVGVFGAMPRAPHEVEKRTGTGNGS